MCRLVNKKRDLAQHSSKKTPSLVGQEKAIIAADTKHVLDPAQIKKAQGSNTPGNLCRLEPSDAMLTHNDKEYRHLDESGNKSLAAAAGNKSLP